MASSDLTFVDVPIIQNNVDKKFGVVLGDIESRMPKGHQYSSNDLITWAHETTHGLNNNIRNKYHKDEVYYNAFYVLEGKALLLQEPKFLISDIADKIPNNLRGDIYNLYIISQQNSWNDRPLYIWDEWSAYINGVAVRTDLGITDRIGTVEFMWEMAVYSAYVAIHANNDIINQAYYYMLNRTSVMYYSSKNTPYSDAYLSKIKSTKELIDYFDTIGFKFLTNV